MNRIQSTQTPPENNEFVVEFYPSVDDYVHIASKVGGSVPNKTVVVYAYYLFLFLNTILFPAFLLFNDFLFAALIVFLINVGTLVFILPRVNSAGFRRYYEHLIGNRENEIAKVTLTQSGLHYVADDGESFWPWRRFSTIEETEASIFFYYDGNGVAVRKSGFAYKDDANSFVAFANRRLQEIHTDQLSPTE